MSMIGRLINDELINEDDIRSIFLIYLGMDVSFKMLVQLLRSKYQVVFELLFDNLFICCRIKTTMHKLNVYEHYIIGMLA